MAKKPNGKSGKSEAKRGPAKAAPGKTAPGKTAPGQGPAGPGPQSGAPFADPAAAAQSAQKAGQLPPNLQKLQDRADRGLPPNVADPGSMGEARANVAQMLGEITWLLTMSPGHRYFFIADFEWLIMAPLMLSQFKLFRDTNGKPAGLVLWAKLDEEGENRLEAGVSKIRPQDWKAGDRLWIVEMIDLTNANHQRMLDELKATVFLGQSFKYHRTGPDGRRTVVQDRGSVPS